MNTYEMFTRADLDFAEFVLTRSKDRVRRERYLESNKVLRTRMYDQETERLRTLMRHERKAA